MTAPFSLRCEYLRDPDTVDVETPRLSWAWTGPSAQAWQVRVAQVGDVFQEAGWQDADLPGPGLLTEKLAPMTTYQWQVRVHAGSEVSPWSETARFTTGLRGQAWDATWIGAREAAPPADPGYFRNGGRDQAPPPDSDSAVVLLRRDFTLTAPARRAVLAVCGLGYSEVTLDGCHASDAVLDPPFTDYAVRVGYRTMDVTELLGRVGDHTLGVALGHGFYHLITPDLFQFEKAGWRQPPRLLLRLEIEQTDGSSLTVVSGPDWQCGTGAVMFACVRGGETHDLRLAAPGWNRPGFAASAWSPALKVTSPVGALVAASITPMTVSERRVAQTVTLREDGAQVLDFGRHLTGWVELSARGSAGTCIRIEHVELLHNPTECAGHTYGRFQVGEFILAGTGETERFSPRMTCHGFRYAIVHGAPGPIAPGDATAAIVHTRLERIGRFSCSDERLNRLYEAAARTLLSGAHGMPGAEETREKMGWSWDADLLTDANQLTFDTTALYAKYQQDLIDSQAANGHIPPIVPTHGWGNLAPDGGREYCDDPWWGSTLAGVTASLWRWTGDRALVERAYEPVVRYLDWLGSTAVDGEIRWNLGDWLDEAWKWPEGPGLTPIPYTSGLAWIRLARLAADFARILGRDEKPHATLADQLVADFNRRYFDAECGVYRIRSQTGQALPLAVGVVPSGREAGVRRALREIASADGEMTAGFLGARPTIDELMWGDEGSSPALAYQLLTAPRRGWMWMLQSPEATLAEHLRGDDKHLAHHPYAAFVAACLHRGIAGWFPDFAQPGLRGIIVRPGLVPQIQRASASHESPHGLIRMAWRREAGCVTAEISTPAVVGIRLDLPASALELPACAKPLSAARPGGTSWQLPGGEYRVVFADEPGPIAT